MLKSHSRLPFNYLLRYLEIIKFILRKLVSCDKTHTAKCQHAFLLSERWLMWIGFVIKAFLFFVTTKSFKVLEKRLSIKKDLVSIQGLEYRTSCMKLLRFCPCVRLGEKTGTRAQIKDRSVVNQPWLILIPSQWLISLRVWPVVSGKA